MKLYVAMILYNPHHVLWLRRRLYAGCHDARQCLDEGGVLADGIEQRQCRLGILSPQCLELGWNVLT